MRDLRSPIDDTVVTLVFHGSIVALAVVSALGAEDRPPQPTTAISVVVATATVLYIGHVFAALVPRAARAGRLHREHLAAALVHDAPLLLSVIVPVVPLALAATGLVSVAGGIGSASDPRSRCSSCSLSHSGVETACRGAARSRPAPRSSSSRPS